MKIEPLGSALVLRVAPADESSVIAIINDQSPEYIVVDGGTTPLKEGERVIVKAKRSDSWTVVYDGHDEYILADSKDILARRAA